MATKPIAAQTLIVPELAADPAQEANAIKVYSKDVAGITQLFAIASDGTVFQLTPASAAVTIERYVCTGAEGTDFMVTLTTPEAADTYSVVPALAFAPTSPIVGINCPDDAAGDRTTTEFRVQTSAALVAGDFIDFAIIPR